MVRGAGCGVRVRVGDGASIALATVTMARDFTELAAWQRSDELRRFVIEFTARPNVARDFRFCSQCKDAARSTTSNIAEGFGRWSHRDFARKCQNFCV